MRWVYREVGELVRFFGTVIVAATLCVACGYPRPKQVEGKPGVYRFAYCAKEHKCFRAAEKICDGGFRITKYGHRPEEFVCDK